MSKFHVICVLPNASENISGVPFKRHQDGEIVGVITVDPVDAETAGMFKGVPGYTIVDADKPLPVAAAAKPAAGAEGGEDAPKARGGRRKADAPAAETVKAPEAPTGDVKPEGDAGSEGDAPKDPIQPDAPKGEGETNPNPAA